MDLLMECASVFKNLMNYQYRFTLGRKGKLKVITLGFSETDFHHLVGLHKLRDTEVARANRGAVFRAILSGSYYIRHNYQKYIYRGNFKQAADVPKA